MKKINKKFSIGISACAILLSPLCIKAATVAPGARVSVNLSCKNVEGVVAVEGNNATIASSSGSWCDRNNNISAVAIVGNSGVATVNLVAKEATADADTPNPSEFTGVISSASFTIAVPNTGGATPAPTPKPQQPSDDKLSRDDKSADNLLSSLSLSTGTLTPEFNPEVMEYQVTLKPGTTSTSISAQAKDTKATIQGTGDKELVEGDNAFEVKVIAENGAERIYKINIYLEEKNLTLLNFNKLKYGIVTKVDRLQAPNGFEKATLKVNGKDVPVWKNANMKLTLLYLRDEDGKSNFYIYDEKKGKILSVYQPIQLVGKEFIQLSVPRNDQKRKGMKYSTKIKIGDLTLSGWEYEDPAYQNYVSLYLMNSEGKTNYYLYEKTEGTLQVAPDMAAISQTKYDELESSVSSLNTWKIVGMIGTIGFAILAGIGFYLNMVNQKRYLSHRREMYESDQIDNE